MASNPITPREVAALEAALEKVAHHPEWVVNVHQSGSTNVVFRTGDCWNEHGHGMLFAQITLYNMGAFSEGLTEDGVALERHQTATLIALLRNLAPRLLATFRERGRLLEEAERALGFYRTVSRALQPDYSISMAERLEIEKEADRALSAITAHLGDGNES